MRGKSIFWSLVRLHPLLYHVGGRLKLSRHAGIGLNTADAGPTTSLNALLAPGLAPFRIERLLARILTVMEGLYEDFRRRGFSTELEQLYYSHWLHTDQIIKLEDDVVDAGDGRAGGLVGTSSDAGSATHARVLGITRDFGQLRVQQLSNGRVWQLQSDGNSFDFFKGLVRRKV